MALQPFRNFRTWADGHAVKGLTSEGAAARYVPHSAQYRYWNPTTIKAIIQSRNSITSAADVPDYMCIFSILVYMEGDGVSAFHYFDEIMRRGQDDATLPWNENLNGRHDIFGSTEEGRLALDNFIETQWMFYPMPTQPFLAAHPAMLSRVFMPNGRAKSMNNRLVNAKQIFPITEVFDRPTDVSRATRRVTVSHMKVHSPSSTQHPSPAPNIVVFKTYPPGDEKIYNDECRGYTAMRDAYNHDHILQCLGSFHYITESGEQISTIMLERADSGTLRDLFSGNQVPYRVEHVRTMWESFLGALYGLATIHNRNSSRGYLCFHQDLKPSNFFLSGSNDEQRPFAYVIKIGDFGSSHSRTADPDVPVENSPDKGATRTYGPPETYLGDSLNFKVESTVDMWAFGCIMIEMAVWITGGKLALDDFRRARLKETEGLKQHKSLGRSDCFHDGSDVLSSVKDVVRNIEENRRQHDNLTLDMVDLALKYVLIGKNERLHADQLIPKLHRVLREGPISGSSKEIITTQSSGPSSPLAHFPSLSTVQREPRFPDVNPWSPDILALTQSPASEVMASPSALFPASPPELPDNSRSEIARVELPVNIEHPPLVRREVPREAPETDTQSSFPFVSITDLEEWANGDKTHSRELRGQTEAKSLLDGRDFVFLIDNSKHANGYKDEMKTWTTSLTYLLKTIDRDGIDVANTSSPQAGKTVKTRKDMAKFVDQTFARESRVDCIIEHALNTILNPIKARWTQRQAGSATSRRNRLSISGIGQRNQASRGVTVLVFTNGMWEDKPGGTCGAEKPILSLIDSMRKNDIPRTQVSIQFVRLGSEEHGKRRLEILDDELDKDFDIVDTKPTTASIWDILIGPMQAGTDNKIATSS